MTTPISTLPASPAIQIVPAHARRAARFDLRVLTMNPPAFEAALTAQRARCERLTALGAPGPILRYERDRLTVYTDAQGPRSAPTRRKARAADLRAWLASHPACLWSIADAKHRCTTACSIQPAVYIATCSHCGRMHRELGVHVNGWCPSWMCKRPQGDGQPFTFTRVLADPQRLSRDC
jgi:hypothetical protein